MSNDNFPAGHPLLYPWQPKPNGWGFLVGGIVCDFCGRWQTKHDLVSGPLRQYYQQKGWTFQDDGKQSCPVCSTLGVDKSVAICEAAENLKVAKAKQAYWSGVVRKEQRILTLLLPVPAGGADGSQAASPEAKK